MASEVLIKNTLVIYTILLLALVSVAAPTDKEISAISKALNSRTNGNNPFYSKILSPALSLDVSKNKSDRVQTVNDQLVSELSVVLGAFKSAGSEAKKLENTTAAVAGIEANVVKEGGAFITFTDSNPSAAFSRTFLMIPKKIKVGMTSKNIFDVLTSYKRSPKPSDHVYEYSSAQDLTQGAVLYTEGNDNSWKNPKALKPFDMDKDIVLKKCRQLLGWRCITSLYQANNISKGVEASQLLFISTYDLTQNPDHPEFAGDKRGVNQYSGSTALYIVKESADWILLYGVDAQWNDGKLSFQGAIQKEFKKDFERLKERISSDLQVEL
jgi:hypothetical protein